MKKTVALVLAAVIMLAFGATAFALGSTTPEQTKKVTLDFAGVKEDQTESGKDMVSDRIPFAYIHNPKDNPEAMKDIVENPDAVYGFSPDPESTRLGP